MKTKTKTATVLTALLAGTVAVSAHPHQLDQNQRKQQGRRQAQHFQGQQRQGRQMPPRYQGQQQTRRNTQQYRGQQRKGRQGRPQFRGQQRQNRQVPPRFQGQREFNPQRRSQISAKKRQAALKRFDTAGDGQLSQEERKAAKQAKKERQRGKPGNAADRPTPAPEEE